MSRLSPPRQALLVLACEPLRFVVSLRMRDLVDLEARISSSQLVPRAELEQTYLPLKADYDRVSAWLVAQGFALTLTDRNHTNLFARGSIAQASATFGVAFARVSTGEFSSAVTAPSIPAEFAAVVVGIEGLQPHIRMHVPRLQRDEASNVGGRITPSSVAAAYTVPGSLTGAGQTIAVIMAATPATTDLTAFWGSAGINDSLANYTLVTVLGGPTTASQTSAINEATLDAEWASGMAPGAQIRFYAVPELSLQDFIAACAQIIEDRHLQCRRPGKPGAWLRPDDLLADARRAGRCWHHRLRELGRRRLKPESGRHRAERLQRLKSAHGLLPGERPERDRRRRHHPHP